MSLPHHVWHLSGQGRAWTVLADRGDAWIVASPFDPCETYVLPKSEFVGVEEGTASVVNE